jgi:adenylosuccinate synthase
MPLAPLSLDPAPFPLIRPAAGCGGRVLPVPGPAPRLCRPLRAAPVAPATTDEPSAAARGRLESLSQVAGVLGTQWGDEGKGKLVDILAQRFDVVARCQVSLSLSLSLSLSRTHLSRSRNARRAVTIRWRPGVR